MTIREQIVRRFGSKSLNVLWRRENDGLSDAGSVGGAEENSHVKAIASSASYLWTITPPLPCFLCARGSDFLSFLQQIELERCIKIKCMRPREVLWFKDWEMYETDLWLFPLQRVRISCSMSCFCRTFDTTLSVQTSVCDEQQIVFSLSGGFCQESPGLVWSSSDSLGGPQSCSLHAARWRCDIAGPVISVFKLKIASIRQTLQTLSAVSMAPSGYDWSVFDSSIPKYGTMAILCVRYYVTGTFL